ncbi:acetate/propionate family kinase [Edaphobacter aggregans]|uniref:acetate/propionate family kinase n=1 Tax=Edaphobacter aggregans TaxID=570835 RepID=UPI0005569BD7|nr:acetate kinase [Edaphobacter aggregans]
MKILVLNSGSSSQKACLYEVAADTPPTRPPAPLWEGRIEWTGDKASISVKTWQGSVRKENLKLSSRKDFVKHLLHTLDVGPVRTLASLSDIDVVGHRVVHGGPHFEEPVIVTPEVRSAIASVSTLAPLHIRAELEGMEIIDNLLGPVPQIAVFDTGFHRQMPLYAQTYPGPYDWFAKGIRRYGFHGINHEYCAARAAQLVGKELRSLKIVSCHLGNGCSVAAIEGGRSIDTTMGFTPLEGLAMGTRSGSVDPGILIYLMREGKLGHEQIDRVLNHESGLLGISGISSDMRDILAAMKQGDARAKLALDIFVHRLQSAIGEMAAALGGLDVLVFTAGVGENSAEVRAATCEKLEFLGLTLDPALNEGPILDCDIATKGSRARIFVIRAEEDWAIATECWKAHGHFFDRP